jgi:Holliday junction DNA helicase RuvA
MELSGIILHKQLHSLLLEVNGVGYQLLVPTRLIEEVVVGNELQLFTYLAVREDALTLYGFTTEPEKDVFELLIGISGIGPKIALSILSTYGPDEIQGAVAGGNSTAFSAVSGIGKKNAERIVLELKNKVWSNAAMTFAPASNELQQALLGLGYSSAEVVLMSKGIAVDLPLSQQIKLALKQTQ